MNVVQIEVFGVSLPCVVLCLVFLGGEVFLSEGRVRIDRYFAVCGKNFAVFCQNERIYLDHVGVLSHEAFIDFCKHVLYLVSLCRNAKVGSSISKLGFVEALCGRHLQFEDPFWVRFSDFFN